jgi:hypothetical protein
VHKLKNAGMSIGREALLSDMIATTACWEGTTSAWMLMKDRRYQSFKTHGGKHPAIRRYHHPEGVRVASI